MAKFEGVKWAPRQMRYGLTEKQFEVVEAEAKVFGVSRSIHYGLFLAFEGIRFFCKKNPGGEVEVIFLNWHLNLDRFHKGIAFNLSSEQQELVPSIEELENVFIHLFFKDPSMRGFLEEMAALGAQGYLRPFTFDEDQSIGVTFPAQPAVRAMACRYDRYLGEPFCGVVVPHMVRAVGINKTGCLKLGVNYLMSVKAVDEAQKLCPEAASALFLDDQPQARIEDRLVTEWDSSCCLFGLGDRRLQRRDGRHTEPLCPPDPGGRKGRHRRHPFTGRQARPLRQTWRSPRILLEHL
jgi:branched-chain amino acid aminotransferase